jgi:hypothetical protein
MNIQKAQKMLQVLIGLPLRITRLAADMRGFHFGQIRPHHRGGNSGEYVLHLLCSWRIEKDDELLTGHRDLWDPKDEDDWDKDWDHNRCGLSPGLMALPLPIFFQREAFGVRKSSFALF